MLFLSLIKFLQRFFFIPKSYKPTLLKSNTVHLLKFYALALLIALDIFFKFPFLKEMQFVLKSINNEQYGKLPKISNSLEKRQLAVGAQ
ncbi:hypothetical protein T10_3987, partial [Trichinella papuae]